MKNVLEQSVLMQVFATRLRERAAELVIAHTEAARRSGLSERRYSHYVNGIREPDLATVVRIAEALQTTPNTLLISGEQQEDIPRPRLFHRLNSAALVLAEEVLEIVLIETEALASARRCGASEA